jgi:hypothetical protein
MVQAAIRNVPKAAGRRIAILIKQLIDTDPSGLEGFRVMRITEAACPGEGPFAGDRQEVRVNADRACQKGQLSGL